MREKYFKIYCQILLYLYEILFLDLKIKKIFSRKLMFLQFKVKNKMTQVFVEKK
jgi:hypothetical protein